MQTPHAKAEAAITPAERAVAFRVLRFERVEPEREQIHRRVHLQPGRDQHQRWFERVDELLRTLPRLMRPRGLYRIDEVASVDPRRLVLTSGATFDGAVGSYLEHARLVATFIVTLGSAVERLSRGWLRRARRCRG